MNKDHRIKSELLSIVAVTILLVTIFLTPVSAHSNYLLQNTKDMNKFPTVTSRDGEILWDNGDPGILVIASQLDNNIPMNAQSADDFLFEEDTNIFGVGWYGGFWNGEPTDVGDFNIFFYEDDGTGNSPTGEGTEHPETTALQSYQFENVVGEEIIDFSYAYEVDLDPPFNAQHGVKYWIVIQMIIDYPPQWGCYQTYNQMTLSPAVQGFLPAEIPFWTDIEGSCGGPVDDLAFYLIGEDENPDKPHLEIADVNGGSQLQVSINNTGETTATDVAINITTEGGLYIFPRDFSFSDITIPVGSEYDVSLSMFGLGLGIFSDSPIIKVTVTASNMDEVSKAFPAKIFIRWIILSTE